MEVTGRGGRGSRSTAGHDQRWKRRRRGGATKAPAIVIGIQPNKYVGNTQKNDPRKCLETANAASVEVKVMRAAPARDAI